MSTDAFLLVLLPAPLAADLHVAVRQAPPLQRAVRYRKRSDAVKTSLNSSTGSIMLVRPITVNDEQLPTEKPTNGNMLLAMINQNVAVPPETGSRLMCMTCMTT